MTTNDSPLAMVQAAIDDLPERVASTMLAFAVAVVDNDEAVGSAQRDYTSALASLAVALGIYKDDDAFALLSSTLSRVAGRALAHGAHQRRVG